PALQSRRSLQFSCGSTRLATLVFYRDHHSGQCIACLLDLSQCGRPETATGADGLCVDSGWCPGQSVRSRGLWPRRGFYCVSLSAVCLACFQYCRCGNLWWGGTVNTGYVDKKSKTS